jgi:hypothetical protein
MFSLYSLIRLGSGRRHADCMDDAEIKRLRREIHRTYGSSPHKKKVWITLLEMYGEGGYEKDQGDRKACKGSLAPGQLGDSGVRSVNGLGRGQTKPSLD